MESLGAISQPAMRLVQIFSLIRILRALMSPGSKLCTSTSFRASTTTQMGALWAPTIGSLTTELTSTTGRGTAVNSDLVPPLHTHTHIPLMKMSCHPTSDIINIGYSIGFAMISAFSDSSSLVIGIG